MEETAEIPVIEAPETPVDASPEIPAGDTPSETSSETLVETPIDPNDPYSLLEQAMNKELGEVPAAEVAKEGEAPAVPPEFAKALEISEFVKSPEHIEQAIRAADEVWKVSSGQIPASQMLENLRAANPQQFEPILTNIAQYIEQITGLKFGQSGEVTPPDPRDQRLTALETRYQQEEQGRQQQAQRQQVQAASKVANEFVTTALKGSFAEGNESHFLAMCEGKSKLPQGEMVRELVAGNTKPLETALKAVRAEETARLRSYNDRLTKNYRTLQSAVPATKATPLKGTANDEAYLPGETAVQYAMRRFNAA